MSTELLELAERLEGNPSGQTVAECAKLLRALAHAVDPDLEDGSPVEEDVSSEDPLGDPDDPED